MVFDLLVRSSDDFETATRERETVVADGVNPDLVQSQVIQNGAGLVEGNFWIGNGRTSGGRLSATPSFDTIRDLETPWHTAARGQA